MLERLRKGHEHKDANGVVDEAFEKGEIREVFDSLKNNPHPAVSDRVYANIFGIIKQHPRVAFGTALAIGVGVYFGLKKIKVPKDSIEVAREEYDRIFQDPLSFPFKRINQTAETAIFIGQGEQFISNLCNSSVLHCRDHPKEVKDFWANLNPYHPIFVEFLDPETRHPGHPNPFIQPKYQKIIDAMLENIRNADPKLGEAINKDIKGKIEKRRIE